MAKLVLVFDNIEVKEYPVTEIDLLIGRARNASVLLDDITVSSQHAILELIDDRDNGSQFYLRDLNSRNGTYLDGKKISRIQITDGDEFNIGWSTFRFLESTAIEKHCR